MYYPDLTSIAAVEDLPMPEFNLRMHCIFERLEWDRGYFAGDDLEAEIEMKPVKGKSLSEVCDQMQKEILTQENK